MGFFRSGKLGELEPFIRLNDSSECDYFKISFLESVPSRTRR